MKSNNILFLALVSFVSFSILILTSCDEFSADGVTSDNTEKQRVFGVFTVQKNDSVVSMNGEIGSQSLADFNRMVASFPEVSSIEIVNCDGSSDDEVNLRLSRLVYSRAMSIHVKENGVIASGGVDFFLAGRSRTLGAGARVGVHAWSDGGRLSAVQYPVGHSVHQAYISYYMEVGFSQKEAENFYYFTISAAPADEIHFMSQAEIITYNIVK